MIVSTKGRYALRVMVRFAQRGREEFIPLKEIAEGEEISQKYLESIMTLLSKGGLVDAVHGKGGGYKLGRNPDEYTVGEVLRLTEGNLAPVSCLEANAEPCKRAAECRTLKMWTDFYKMTNEFFDSITIADLMKTDTENDYVI